MKAFSNSLERRCAAGYVPDFALHRRQMTDVFRKKIDLGASRFSVGPAAAHFTFARHGAVVVCHGHRQQHLRVKVIGKYAVESQVIGTAHRQHCAFRTEFATKSVKLLTDHDCLID